MFLVWFGFDLICFVCGSNFVLFCFCELNSVLFCLSWLSKMTFMILTLMI